MPPAEPNREAAPRHSERILESEQDPYRAVFDVLPVPLLLCEVGTLSIVAANAAAARLHGVSAERLQGTTLFELRRVSDLTSVLLKRAAGRETALGFGYHVREDGTTVPVQLTVHPIELAGTPLWLCVLKSLEGPRAPRSGEPQRRLLEAVGRITGGVAHDINNLMSVILSFGSIAASRLSTAAAARAELAEICGAAERASHLTKQLLSLSRQRPSSPRPLRLNDVVARLEKVLRRIVNDDTELVLDLGPSLDTVLADASQVEQLLVQLLAETRRGNDPGTVRVETRNVDLETERGSERHVLLRVTGSEGSLTPEVATLASFVEAGSAWLETEPGVGARFVACFPSVEGRDAGAPPAPRRARSETVLVVQDNPHLRKTLRNYFTREGFRVLEAESGLEALREVELCEKVDLLLTDFVLPDGNGGELGRALRERCPSLRVLVAIGEPEQRAALRLDERTDAIRKPFHLREFGALIERLLEQPDLARGAPV